jgi:hypothetical protein
VSAIRGAFLSLTSGTASGDDSAYLRWHLLDHMPEQHTVPGIRLGSRWIADDRCLADRIAVTDDLAPVRHAVCYLLTEPLEETLSEFARLGRRLADAGRYPEPATPHLLGAYELHDGHAAPRALVSAAAVPFRPHRGVHLIVERPVQPELDRWWTWHDDEHVPAVLDTDGVAGVLSFRSTARLGTGADQGERFGTQAPWDPGGSLVTLVYLDGDLGETAARLEPLLRARWAGGAVAPRLAGPFASPVAFDAWPPGS